MKILGIVSSGRKNGHTSKVVALFQEQLNQISTIHNDSLQFETLFLVDYTIEHCKGCRTCIDYGEDKCPLKDDLKIVKARIKNADAVIFSSPVYVGDVNSAMKALIDRLAYICHRQEFYDKCALILATTNATSLKRTIHTIGAATYSWGFKTIGTKGFKTYTSNDSKETIKNRYQKDIVKLAGKFYSGIKEKSYLNPSLISLITFKIQQKYRGNPELSNSLDFIYWSRHGWTDSKRSYFFEHQGGFLKTMLSKIIQRVILIFL